jgi:hypothetical protein
VTDRYDLMRHALGVRAYVTVKSKGGRRWKKPYRNHFCAGGDDVAAWESLVVDGLAQRMRVAAVLTDGHPAYSVTDAGRTAALDGLTFKRRWGYGVPTNGGGT